MNTDIFEGKWKQLSGRARVWWGKLTDDDWETIAGKRDMLVGTLQERYGWTRQYTEDEITRRLQELEDRQP